MDTCLHLASASEDNAQTSRQFSPPTREVDSLLVFSGHKSHHPRQRLILKKMMLALLQPGKIEGMLSSLNENDQKLPL